jgi:hypothetical protein
MNFLSLDLLSGWRGRFRVIAAVIPWLALPSFFYCRRHHLCMDGHLAHGPYPQWQWLSDYTWLVGFVGASVVALFSNMPLRILFALFLLPLPMLQVLWSSPAGPRLSELLLLIGALFLSLYSLLPRRRSSPHENTA